MSKLTIAFLSILSLSGCVTGRHELAVVSAELTNDGLGGPLVVGREVAEQVLGYLEGLRDPESYAVSDEYDYDGIGIAKDKIVFRLNDGRTVSVEIGLEWKEWQLVVGQTDTQLAVIHGPVSLGLRDVLKRLKEEAQPRPGTDLDKPGRSD